MTLAAPLTILSRFSSSMGQALARRGRALLDSPSMAEDVARLGVTELYFMIKELGVDEALPLLLASGEGRLQALVDFDCWDKDVFEPADLDVWLAPFAAEGPEALAEAFLALDSELQILFLQSCLEVFEGPANDNPNIPNDRPSREVPGGLFTLVAKDADLEVDPLTLADALMAQSMEGLFQLLTALNWELPSSTEEQAFQFRANRMMDLGFMAPERAAQLFAPPPKVLTSQLQSDPDPQPMPAVYAAALVDDKVLLHRAMAGVTNGRDGARLETELVCLINACVVAWNLTVRNLADVHDTAFWVRNVLSLGLEVLCGDDDGALDARLTGTVLCVPLMHLFQRGMAEITPLARQAQRLARKPEVQAWLSTPPDVAAVPSDHDTAEAMERAFLAGLSRGRPYWAGQDSQHPNRRDMWRSRPDLAQSTARLQALVGRFGG